MTEKQRAILRLFAFGKSLEEIAAMVGRSVKTVEHQVAAVKRKLGFKGLAEIVRFAVREKIIEELDVEIFKGCEFTPRELETLCLIAEGKKTEEIAAALGISPKTVDKHRAALCETLFTPERREALGIKKERMSGHAVISVVTRYAIAYKLPLSPFGQASSALSLENQGISVPSAAAA